MAAISLCMIVKDEEAVLERCLDCFGELADEIVIVDTGSSDRTREIAGKYTSRVYEFPWCGDFSAARNYGFERATKEYCMWVDADDVMRQERPAAVPGDEEEASGGYGRGAPSLRDRV